MMFHGKYVSFLWKEEKKRPLVVSETTRCLRSTGQPSTPLPRVQPLTGICHQGVVTSR